MSPASDCDLARLSAQYQSDQLRPQLNSNWTTTENCLSWWSLWNQLWNLLYNFSVNLYLHKRPFPNGDRRWVTFVSRCVQSLISARLHNLNSIMAQVVLLGMSQDWAIPDITSIPSFGRLYTLVSYTASWIWCPFISNLYHDLLRPHCCLFLEFTR